MRCKYGRLKHKIGRRVCKKRAIGKSRAGKNYYKGDRVRRGTWSKKRWGSAIKKDRKRYGGKYEKWEKRGK